MKNFFSAVATVQRDVIFCNNNMNFVSTIQRLQTKAKIPDNISYELEHVKTLSPHEISQYTVIAILIICFIVIIAIKIHRKNNKLNKANVVVEVEVQEKANELEGIQLQTHQVKNQEILIY